MPPVNRGGAMDHQVLDEIVLVGVAACTGGTIGEGKDYGFRVEKHVLPGAFLGTGPFLAVGRRRPGWRRFQPAGCEGGPRLLSFEDGNLVAKVLNLLLQESVALLPSVDDHQQSVHKGRAFGVRVRREINLQAVQNRKPIHRRECLFR